MARLAGLTRIPLTSKVGRKTFATLKLAQGIEEDELVASYRKTARKVPGDSPGKAAA